MIIQIIFLRKTIYLFIKLQKIKKKILRIKREIKICKLFLSFKNIKFD